MKKSWDECNKPYALAKEYFFITGQNVFARGKPSSSFFAVMNFFKKQEDTVLNLLHEYISTLDSQQNMTITELFTFAEKWNTKTKVAEVTVTQKKNYLEVLGDL